MVYQAPRPVAARSNIGVAVGVQRGGEFINSVDWYPPWANHLSERGSVVTKSTDAVDGSNRTMSPTMIGDWERGATASSEVVPKFHRIESGDSVRILRTNPLRVGIAADSIRHNS